MGNDDWDSGLEISGAIILVFLVVREITFLDTELRDSVPAIGSVVFSLDFLNALIGLGKLDAFLHVLEVIAPTIVGKGVFVGHESLPGTGRVVVHVIIGS